MLQSHARLLRAVKVVHTVVWAFFAGAIVLIPVFAYRGNFGVALGLIGVVMVEVAVLVVNEWKCPLTSVAAQYADERPDNFDIYLPVWLARHNKTLFGTLYVAGAFYTFARWMGWA